MTDHDTPAAAVGDRESPSGAAAGPSLLERLRAEPWARLYATQDAAGSHAGCWYAAHHYVNEEGVSTIGFYAQVTPTSLAPEVHEGLAAAVGADWVTPRRAEGGSPGD